MREYHTCLSILLAFGIVGLVMGDCTPSTCPPGPVYVEFPNSDCTGEPTFSAVTDEAGVCNNGDQMLADEEGLTFLRFNDGNIHCDRSWANTTYNIDIYKFGQCAANAFGRRDLSGLPFASRMERSSMAAASMYLANVNDTITPYAFDNQWIQPWKIGSAICYSLGNCTNPDGSTPPVFEDVYYSPGCVSPYRSSFNPNEPWNTCINFLNKTYVKLGCFDEHGSYFAQFNDPECTIPSLIYASRVVCATSYRTTHCNAPITEFPRIPSAGPQAPTSTSSSIRSSALMLIIAMIATIAFF
jgi:hypothetical protein